MNNFWLKMTCRINSPASDAHASRWKTDVAKLHLAGGGIVYGALI
jgi:hypothetical protein